MTQISDAELTENGLTEMAAGRILLIACGALAREILDLKKANGWDHMDLTCLPAKLHLYPEKITEGCDRGGGQTSRIIRRNLCGLR